MKKERKEEMNKNLIGILNNITEEEFFAAVEAIKLERMKTMPRQAQIEYAKKLLTNAFEVADKLRVRVSLTNAGRYMPTWSAITSRDIHI